MSASTLRAAAALIRERAAAAASDSVGDGPTAAIRRAVDHGMKPTQAEHLGHFGQVSVALAVANLIDTVASIGPVDGGAEWDATVTLARAYLGVTA